jgi:enoyl-CoA hydratase/carnithine racemase
MNSEERVTMGIDGGVADARLNRPEKINALDDAQFAAIVDAGASLMKAPAIRAVDTPLEDALAMAHEIAGKSPQAVRGAKSLLNASPNRGVAEQFEDERRTIFPLLGYPKQIEAVMAYLDKRALVFQD